MSEHNQTPEKVDKLEVKVRSANDRMLFMGNTPANGPLAIDYIPPLGDNLGYMPLELFLLSLASCAGGAVSVLLRRMKKTFSCLEISASGVRRNTHPTCFEQITLNIRAYSDSLDPESLQKAVDMSEKSICPVWAMVDKSIPITAVCEIVPESDSPSR